jgi:ectoine hydroxylase-related dioxygenase (phytanoyl-CoA dioxygenase family)
MFEIGDYEARGYHELPGLLGEADRQRAVTEFDRLESREEVPLSYEAEYDEADGRRRLRKLRRLIWNDLEAWGPMLVRSGVPELARQVLGDGATIVFHAAFLKPAEIGTPVAAHQDQALWSREYAGAFSLWFALTEVHRDNGGLFGCPGSHADGLIEHRDDPRYEWHPSLDLERDDLGEPVHFELDAGDAVMWDRYFVHGSAANTSAADRRGMVVVLADGADPGFDARDSFPIGKLEPLPA